MAMRNEMSDEELENVNGGFFNWNPETMVMTYFHDDGTITTHKILDFDNAWIDSNKWHGQRIPEDNIIKLLVRDGRIEG